MKRSGHKRTAALPSIEDHDVPYVIVASFVIPFFLSVVLCAGIRTLARRRGFVDHPGGHKGHATPVALGGGIAIFLSVSIPVLAGLILAWLLHRGPVPEWLPAGVVAHVEGIVDKTPVALIILGSATALFLLGLRDDVRPLGPGIKLVVQVAVAFAVVGPGNVRALELWGPVPAIGITVLWLVTIINAFNFLDNMDGLAAGVAAIAGSLFAIAAILAGQLFVPVFMLVLVGAVCGYLIFNFPPATLFMGDAGSLVIGYYIAVLTVMTTFVDPHGAVAPMGTLVPLVVLAVPLYDVVSVVILRIRAGQSPFRGDRRHFSHRLVLLGMSPRSAVLTIYLATLTTGLSATLLPQASWSTAALVVAQCLCVVLIIAILEYARANGQKS